MEKMNLNHRFFALTASAMLTVSVLPCNSGIAASAENKTFKIMPLGDSITYGMADEGGYRKYLDVALKQKGCTNFDFVGPEGADSASFNYNGKEPSIFTKFRMSVPTQQFSDPLQQAEYIYSLIEVKR